MATWSAGYIDVLVVVRCADNERRFRVEVNPGSDFQREIRPDLVAALQLGRPEDFTLHCEGTLTDPVIVLTQTVGAEVQPASPSSPAPSEAAPGAGPEPSR